MTIDLYYDYISHPNSYFKFYKSLYDLQINVFNISDFKKKEYIYDKIIVTTMPNNFFFRFPEKIILIKHRKNHNITNSFQIGLTHLVDRNYICPLFSNFVENKNKINKNILIMGNFGYKDFNDMLQNINIFKDYTFILVARNLENYIQKYGHYSNLKIYSNISTIDLINMFYKDIDYFLLLNKIPTVYHKSGISGGVFQALSFGIPLICDELYHTTYNYPESIVYKKSIQEILPILDTIDIKKYQIMRTNIMKYVEKKIFDNNNLIDKYLNFFIKKHNQNNYILKPFLKMINSHNIKFISSIQIIQNKNRIEPMPDIKNINSSNEYLLKIPGRKELYNNIIKNDIIKNDIKEDLIKNNLINVALKKIRMKK